jgi:hypothetical protein
MKCAALERQAAAFKEAPRSGKCTNVTAISMEYELLVLFSRARHTVTAQNNAANHRTDARGVASREKIFE